MTDPGGSLAQIKTKPKETVGKIFALQLPDLSDDPDWGHSNILAPVHRVSSNCPLSIFTLPNKLHACAVSMLQTSVYTLPRARLTSGSKDVLHQLPLAQALTTALQSRKSTADISRILSLPSTPASMLHDMLFGTLTSYEVNARNGTANSFSMVDVMGAAVEIYRARACWMKNKGEKEKYLMLSQNALNMCSVAACLAAFENCKEPEGYDLEPVWQSISLSTCVVVFLEDLMKECIFLADLADLTPNMSLNLNEVRLKEEPMDDNPFLHNLSFDVPILLHLVHPLALMNLMTNSPFMRDIMLDLVSFSGLDLRVLKDILNTMISEVSAIPTEEAMASFAEGHPVPAQYEQLKRIIQLLTTSSAIDKLRLFIKSSDLVDSFANLSASDRPPGDNPKMDVVWETLPGRRRGNGCGTFISQMEDLGKDVGGKMHLQGIVDEQKYLAMEVWLAFHP
ncbi:hypothetical protein DFH29DRAFT_1007943 [Suillus ampliporus]|nr:hypothetical protein DFH29DRAFT_1007943 [Suillus ampliporus]